MVSKSTQRKVAALRLAAYVAQGGLCFYCGRRMWTHTANPHDDNATTADHITPLSLGGHMFGLVVAACRVCNHERGNMPWLYFVALINERKKHDLAANPSR